MTRLPQRDLPADRAREPEDDAVRFRLLGPPGAQVHGEFRSVAGRRQIILFVALALRPRLPVSVDRLVDLLWPLGPPRRRTGALHSHVSRLRRTIGAEHLRFEASAYVLDVNPALIDIHRFEALVERGHRLLTHEAPGPALAAVDRALGLWRGTPFLDAGDSPAVRDEVSRLAELRVDACAVRARARMALGQHADAAGDLRRVTAANPLREDLWALLAVALYRCDRAGDALAALRAARNILIGDLGLQPGPLLRNLETAIRTHSLDRLEEIGSGRHNDCAHD